LFSIRIEGMLPHLQVIKGKGEDDILFNVVDVS
jgi:hypothetical protein